MSVSRPTHPTAKKKEDLLPGRGIRRGGGTDDWGLKREGEETGEDKDLFRSLLDPTESGTHSQF